MQDGLFNRETHSPFLVIAFYITVHSGSTMLWLVCLYHPHVCSWDLHLKQWVTQVLFFSMLPVVRGKRRPHVQDVADTRLVMPRSRLGISVCSSVAVSGRGEDRNILILSQSLWAGHRVLSLLPHSQKASPAQWQVWLKLHKGCTWRMHPHSVLGALSPGELQGCDRSAANHSFLLNCILVQLQSRQNWEESCYWCIRNTFHLPGVSRRIPVSWSSSDTATVQGGNHLLPSPTNAPVAFSGVVLTVQFWNQRGMLGLSACWVASFPRQ